MDKEDVSHMHAHTHTLTHPRILFSHKNEFLDIFFHLNKTVHQKIPGRNHVEEKKPTKVEFCGIWNRKIANLLQSGNEIGYGIKLI